MKMIRSRPRRSFRASPPAELTSEVRRRCCRRSELRPKSPGHEFWISAFPWSGELDLVGPWEMISMWSKHLQGQSVASWSRKPASRSSARKGCRSIRTRRSPIARHWIASSCPAARGRASRSITTSSFTSWPSKPEVVKRSSRFARGLYPALRRPSGRAARDHHWSSLARLAELGGVEVVQERVVRTATSGRPPASRPESTWRWLSSSRSLVKRWPARSSSAPNTIRLAGVTGISTRVPKHGLFEARLSARRKR